MADAILEDFSPCSPDQLEHFVANVSLEKDTRPLHTGAILTSPLDRWFLEHPGGKRIIMEKISFPSEIRHGRGRDTATFYLYRTRDIGREKIILWVPGLGVSDFAFRFIKRFFEEELKRGYAVLFYVLPYHLERTEKGHENGEGFFSADTRKNVSLLMEAVRELRTVHRHLAARGVSIVGGWGGSIGATILLLASQTVRLDHLCIMIPVIDLETVMVKNHSFKKVLERYGKAGISRDLLRRAYGIVNPINYPLPVPPGRTHIMYARYDQLTPETEIIRYARDRGISGLSSYRRSHATILLSGKLYRDCGRFLDSLQ